MVYPLLLAVVLVLLIGALPTWRHSANWGYAPSGVLVVAAIALVVLSVAGNA